MMDLEAYDIGAWNFGGKERGDSLFHLKINRRNQFQISQRVFIK